MKKYVKLMLSVLFVLLVVACGKEKEEITVYSCFEEDYIMDYLNDFKQKYPNIEVNLVRDSSGIISSKFEAEKNNPQADVIWGVATTGFLHNKDYLLPFEYNVDNIDKKFYDTTGNQPKWVGISSWMTAFTFNKVEGAQKSIEPPLSYEDLLKDQYSQEVVMPNPASSGTGFLTVSAWIQLLGEEKAWEYMDKLNKNMKMYVHSGSAPTKMAAQGENLVGIGMGFEGLREKNKGLPVEIIFPKEGSGWEMEIVGIVKKDKVKDGAKKFAEWAISEDAMKLYSKNRGIITDGRITPVLEGYPKDVNNQMIENNLQWAAENRDRILKEWERRYGKGE
ncbi:putative 2-aminoethylphosphonate ABC transporter substrate-binding protein [Fusobacterium sp.]|uniref:putative 2-aminoethylphosphonate ABC transporter substrate-binding protein n=1 Tax=Fusobacterium sp. TaxID=68766 RepID=UPI0025BD0553|nr:putative 2-aminoethylphosphonate ABC transporter substrate-binding protein [Fusobacterium sp.]